MKPILIILLSSIAVVATAQDFIVTSKGDTLRGEVVILTYDRLDRVEVTADKKKQHFTCLQARFVSIKNEIYQPLKMNDGFKFGKLVVDGYLSLYLTRRPNGFSYEIETLLKKNGTMLEVPGLSFKKSMANFLSECPATAEKIKNDELTRKDLREIITQYNYCIGSGTATLVSEKTISSSDPVMTALTSLKQKVSTSNDINQKDALDILKDITAKVTAKENVPNYLAEGFKENVKNSPEILSDFEALLKLIKK